MAMLKYNLIPKPNFYKTLDGTYTVSSGTKVLCAEEFLTAESNLKKSAAWNQSLIN